MLGTIFDVITTLVGAVAAFFVVCVALFFIAYAIAYGVAQGSSFQRRQERE